MQRATAAAQAVGISHSLEPEEKGQRWGGTPVAGPHGGQGPGLMPHPRTHSREQGRPYPPAPPSLGAFGTFTGIFYEWKGLFWNEKPGCESG